MPRLNRHGEVATNAEGAALGARWLDDETAIFQQPVDPANPGGAWQMATRARGQAGRGVALPGVSGGCNDLAAGSGVWMRRLDGHVPPLSGSRPWPFSDGYVGDVDHDGGWVCVSADGLTVAAEWGTFTRPAVQGGTRYRSGLACWTDGGRVRVHDWLDGDLSVQQVGPGAAWALAFRAVGRIWICYQTDARGGVCHPIDQPSEGYRYGDPLHIYDPDVLVSDDGAAAVIEWATREGQRPEDLARLVIPDMGHGMVPLAPIVVPPVPPPPPPPPPPERTPVKIPSDVQQTIREFADLYLVPKGDGSEAWVDQALRHYWMAKLAQTVRARHGEAWGRKRADMGRPVSKESLARQQNGQHDGWDLLRSASSGQPELQIEHAGWHDLVAEGNQVFVPVEPYDWIERVPRSSVFRPTLPRVVGLTAFDWAHHQQPEWLTFARQSHLPWLVLVVASTHREYACTLAEGRAHLATALSAISAAGLRALVSINVDTAEHISPSTGAKGLTKDDIREHTREVGRILANAGIVAAALGNEMSHGVEQWFMTDPSFLLELDALVPASIPLSWGASHGQERPRRTLAGGSWYAHHADRGATPEENAQTMADAQRRFGIPVVDRESIGFDDEAIPGKRVNDRQWARRQAEVAKTHGLGGVIFHSSAGLTARVEELDDVQRDAAQIIGEVMAGAVTPIPVPPPTPPTPEGPVTPEQIGIVFAGAFFERITALLRLTGTVEQRRAAVQRWAVERLTEIEAAYQDIFHRAVDLEGSGSRLLRYLEVPSYSVTDLRRELQAAFDRGDR